MCVCVEAGGGGVELEGESERREKPGKLSECRHFNFTVERK